MVELGLFIRRKGNIDLLTLSHFDDDHINGVTALLRQFRVEALLLPYMPLWERLLIAFDKGIGLGDAGMNYYINPIAFLRELGGDNLGRIIQVEPGGEDGPLFQPEGGNPPEPDQGDRPWKFHAKTRRNDTEGSSGEQTGQAEPQTETLASGQPLTVEGFWEFCPYNAKRRHPIASTFKAETEVLRGQLLNLPASTNRDELLASLKAIYDKEFGSTGRARNVISLFLYSGPVYSTWQAQNILSPALTAIYPTRHPCYYRVHPYAPGHTDKCSILYTGDGFLNTAGSFNSLNSALGTNRMSKLGVVQVPHHGAKRNWHDGLAQKLNAVFSVFSSDPSRGPTYHPHAEVLRDFWDYSPIQVNGTGCTQCGWLLR